MINLKLRRFFHRWHIYIACMFLPLLLLYTVTGGLYLLEVHGDYTEVIEQDLAITSPWPTDEQQANKLIASVYEPQKFGALPSRYYSRGNNHNWYGFEQEVTLALDDNKAQLIIAKHSLWQQLIMIHKGHAGDYFIVLGIIVSIGLLFSLLSGIILGLNSPKFKNKALFSIAIGAVIVVIGFL